MGAFNQLSIVAKRKANDFLLTATVQRYDITISNEKYHNTDAKKNTVNCPALMHAAQITTVSVQVCNDILSTLLRITR